MSRINARLPTRQASKTVAVFGFAFFCDCHFFLFPTKTRQAIIAIIILY
jgi:hypothetical protein